MKSAPMILLRKVNFKPSFFIIFCLLFSALGRSSSAWNEEFTLDNTPTRRTVCLKGGNSGKAAGWKVRSIIPDEPCEPSETRYTLVVGAKPKGSYALIPLPYYERLYPPWVVGWPASGDQDPKLWHFTCFAVEASEILGTSMPHRTFRGEITAPAKGQSCESAFLMARKVCSEDLNGDEILEQCFGSLKLYND